MDKHDIIIEDDNVGLAVSEKYILLPIFFNVYNDY